VSGLDDPIRAIAETARRAAEAAADLDAAAAARRLGEDGLLGVLAPDAVGGLQLPLTAAAAVVAATEAALVKLPVAETMLAARLLAARCPEVAAALVGGESTIAVAWSGTLTLADGRASGTVGRASLGGIARWLIAPVEGGGAALLDLDGAGLARDEERGFDLERPAARIRAEAAAARALPEDAGLAAFRADALLLLAAGALGAAEHCLDRAVAHVSQRRQFGRPLVLFQGLRFELARRKLALEGAKAALAHALAVAGQDPRAEDVARLVARSTVADAAPAIIESAIQLHGGIGFTWEVGLHRHLRRAKEAARALDAMGARAALAERLEQAWAA
jgi:alkylation response protein AidB-like acyl-CoA dehydrogenase